MGVGVGVGVNGDLAAPVAVGAGDGDLDAQRAGRGEDQGVVRVRVSIPVAPTRSAAARTMSRIPVPGRSTVPNTLWSLSQRCPGAVASILPVRRRPSSSASGVESGSQGWSSPSAPQAEGSAGVPAEVGSQWRRRSKA